MPRGVGSWSLLGICFLRGALEVAVEGIGDGEHFFSLSMEILETRFGRPEKKHSLILEKLPRVHMMRHNEKL